jgi:hypothetical protein
MKYIINLYSQLVAKRFEVLYHSPIHNDNVKAMKVLDHYRSVRRVLPIHQCGKHFGNHDGSKKKAFFATQGF